MCLDKIGSTRVPTSVKLFFGFLIGLYIGSLCRRYLTMCPHISCRHCSSGYNGEYANQFEKAMGGRAPKKGFLFIGIMTAQKYLSTRAVSVYNTWGKSINGDVVFFASEDSVGPPGVPIINLAGTDDTYPPQKKSFSLLKYMHDHFIDEYEWFMRVDDDAFIKGDKLEKFLRNIDSTKLQFMGQPGLGTVKELGKLGLSVNENFCMGGPGMVFSRSTLKGVVPYLGTCLQNLYTAHEDVEIGRCVRKYVGISCAWSFELQYIFFQNHKEDKGSFKETLKSKETRNAITLHPIKEHLQQYRVYTYFLSLKIMTFKQKCLTLQREINLLDELLNIPYTEDVSKRLGSQPSLNTFIPEDGEDILLWEYFEKALFTHKQNNPRRGLESSWRGAIDNLIEKSMKSFNSQAKEKGRELIYKETMYGYKRVNPMAGAEYVLDLYMTYRKYRGRKMSLPVRRHVYLQQAFTDIEFTDELAYTVPLPSVSSHYGPPRNENELINFILTLVGRYKIFRRFLLNYEKEVLEKGESAILLIIVHHSDIEPDAYDNSVKLIKEVQGRHGYTRVRYQEVLGPFIKTKALELGAAPWSEDSLLFFIDVDILFKHDSLYRIRRNTKQGLLVYFPIVFSQYDPETVCRKAYPCKVDPYDYNTDSGYWRRVGFGMLGIYKTDLRLIGGYDETIIGWGKEDVDMYLKTVNSNLTLFRSVDPSMSHIFHRIRCDPKLPEDQQIMCTGARYSTYGSEQHLTRRIYSYPDYTDIKKK